MSHENEYDDNMVTMLQLIWGEGYMAPGGACEELTYALETLADYERHFIECGFVDVVVEDASEWYQRQVNREYELIRTDLYPRMVELLGQDSADHFVEDWRALTVVLDKGELRPGRFRAVKPGAVPG